VAEKLLTCGVVLLIPGVSSQSGQIVEHEVRSDRFLSHL
jgi:hypothetical protein